MIVILGLVSNAWYYFNLSTPSVAEVPEVLLPPTEEEKMAIASDLEARVGQISNEYKAKMMQSLAAESNADVKLEDRNAAISSLKNYK